MTFISELLNTVCTVKEGVKISRDGRYDTTTIDTTDTDTSSCSIDTWFLATLIWYLAHVMYFGVPGTCGTSVPSERFSKAGEVVAATRSNIKPKNVDMILFWNKKLNVFWHCAESYWIFLVCLGEGGSIIWYRITSAWYCQFTSKNQPPLTISNPSFDSAVRRGFQKLEYRAKVSRV